MNYKHIIHIIFVFFVLTLNAQTLDVLLAESERLEKQRLAFFGEERDSINKLFYDNAEKILTAKEFCKTVSSSSFLENSVASKDNKIRVFSWNDLLGGSYHTFTNYLQYKTAKGSCKTIPFDVGKEDEITEVKYYKIETIRVNQKTIYVLFGYGTYGGGQHHANIKFFEFVDNKPKEYFKFYPNKKDLVVYANRTQNPDILLKNNVIRYKQFNFDEEIGFYKDSFIVKTIPLVEK